MVVVAIAGGSGNLGRALVDALKAKGGSEIIILARKVSVCRYGRAELITQDNPEREKEIGVPIVAVDYSSVENVVNVLENHKIDTLISTVDSNAGPEPELVLIQAAERSTVTKRYIPCLWGIEYTKA
jgi:NAD(P)-dependent dehydrogenase (short-subunit alcohol dehydrogenase family)